MIFRDGFASHGNNRNLQQHIRDDSCASGSRDSTILRLSQILMSLIIQHDYITPEQHLAAGCTDTESVQTIVSTAFRRLLLILSYVVSSLVILSE